MQPTTGRQSKEQLAAKLLHLTQQEKAIESEKKSVKEELELLYADNLIPTKDDIPILFSDGTTQKVRLQRVQTGTYFKVGDNFKDDYSAESHKLQAKYMKAGKAEMAEKACSWRAQVVK